MIRNKSENHLCSGDAVTGFEDAERSSYDSNHEYVFKMIDGCEDACHEVECEEIAREVSFV